MFDVGDRVVYPMHGAGIIESIEEREILGETNRYYVMNMPVGDMKVMIPLDHAVETGLRDVIPSGDVEDILSILTQPMPDVVESWNRRYRDNMDKIRGGDIRDVASVVHELVAINRQKGLSTGEKRMLDVARQILVSELLLAAGEDKPMFKDRLENLLDGA